MCLRLAVVCLFVLRRLWRVEERSGRFCDGGVNV